MVGNSSTTFWGCRVLQKPWNIIVDPCSQPGDTRENQAGLELGMYIWGGSWSWCFSIPIHLLHGSLSFGEGEKLVPLASYHLNICWERQIEAQQIVGQGRPSFRTQTFTFCPVQWKQPKTESQSVGLRLCFTNWGCRLQGTNFLSSGFLLVPVK